MATANPAPEPDPEGRFAGVGRLYGRPAAGRFRAAHVLVIGLGGVGSWTVEALARSGVGRLTLVDFDDVCVTNVNRQLHALDGTIGRPKVEVMAERVSRIAPDCVVRAWSRFFTPDTAPELLVPDPPYDVVVDAIDTVRDKAFLLATCRLRDLPVVACGGAGGKRDPTRIRVADLAHVTHDRLLKQVRKVLRRDHGWPRGESEPCGIAAVYSAEPAVYPWSDGSVCAETEPGTELRSGCDAGLGTATHVTGTFGFAAAAEVLRHLAATVPPPSVSP
jgi:tRNA A37 threonylcarbamoyladenosine dehydratase